MKPAGKSVLLFWLCAVVMVQASSAVQGPAPPPAGSEYLVDVWDTDRGLPSYSALSFAQTPDGYLWVGTYAGLARFDGVQFKVIDASNTPGFPGVTAFRLYVDRRGWLWVSTEGGMACLRQGHWTAFSAAQGWPSGFARRFVEDRDGNLLVSNGKRLFRFVNDHFL